MRQALSYNQFKAIEWNANGVLHSYGNLQKRAFVVEVFLTSDVDGAILQAAVNKALIRMPYYRWAIVRKKGLYYYATNDLPFVIAESEKPRKIGGETTNYHNVDVTFHGDKIDFTMNHGFCDGLGLNRFIEAVLYHYFCMKDNVEYSSEGICTDKVPYDGTAETVDAYLVKTNADRDQARRLASKEGAYCLPELDIEGIQGPTIYRMPVKVKEADLVGWCKDNAASPAAAVSAILAQAVVRVNGLEEGKVRSLAPISLRNFLNAEKTFTNCSAAVFMPMDVADIRRLTTGELAAQARSTLKTQMNGEAALIVSSGINLMTHLAKRVPTFWLKNKVLTLSESKQNTFYVDYVGSLKTNDYSDQVREVRYLSSDVCGGSMYLMLSATAGYFFMNFLQTFDTKRYYEAFCAILGEQGIPYEQLECDSYLNPEVEFGKEQR